MVLKSELSDAKKQKELVSSVSKRSRTQLTIKMKMQPDSSSRYATSLLSLVVEQKKLEDTLSDMKHIKSICLRKQRLIFIVKKPNCKNRQKDIYFIWNIFNVFGVSDVTMSFIHIVTSKKREMYLEGMAESFISLYKVHNNIETVTSNQPPFQLMKTQNQKYYLILRKTEKQMLS